MSAESKSSGQSWKFDKSPGNYHVFLFIKTFLTWHAKSTKKPAILIDSCQNNDSENLQNNPLMNLVGRQLKDKM